MNTTMDPPRPLLQLVGCPPALDERLETLFCWLGSRGLVEQGGVMDLPTVDLGRAGPLDGACFALAESTARGHQVRRKRRLEMKALKDRHGTTAPGGVSPEAVWGAVKQPEYSVRTLNWAKLPADAMAFYRPFHQEAIKAHWHLEPRGYREAEHYIDGAYVLGGAHLLAQMFGAPGAVASAPLICLAKHLMPNGFTALVQKPGIPTYLVGGEQDLAAFHALVPAPNEAYTQLFWPYDTKAFDAFVAKKLAEEKAAREARKKAQEARRAARHMGQLDLFEASNP